MEKLEALFPVRGMETMSRKTTVVFFETDDGTRVRDVLRTLQQERWWKMLMVARVSGNGNERCTRVGAVHLKTVEKVTRIGVITGSFLPSVPSFAAMTDRYNCSFADFLSPPVERCQVDGLCNRSFQLVENISVTLEDLCLSQEEFLRRHLGPRRSPVFLPVCVSFLLIFLVGAVGNALTCAVIAGNKVMHTPTNYYLFSLAVSDLLVLLLGMPLELYEMWSNYPFLFGQWGCHFKTFLFETVCFASILNVTALSVERYVAVVHPLRAKYVVTRAHAKRVILALWAASMLCAVPNTSLHGIRLESRFGHQLPESATCTLIKPTWIYNLVIQVTTGVFFLLPMLTISVLYLLIGLQLRREKMMRVIEAKSGLDRNGYSSTQKVRHRQVTKMLCVLVVVFGICWAPFHADRLMWSFIKEWTESQKHMFECVHILSGVFFYLSSVVNPILYNLMSTRFREMFREVACRRGRRGYSPSVTRVTRLTLRSTVCEAPPGLGALGSEGEDGPREQETAAP
ncbi:neuromedin-U receptor 1-like [Scleropages formosus]|nr:neuromedin-U receptor 1-like [Scleropages formosus]